MLFLKRPQASEFFNNVYTKDVRLPQSMLKIKLKVKMYFYKLSNRQIIKSSNYQIVKLSNRQIIKSPNYQIVKLSNH